MLNKIENTYLELARVFFLFVSTGLLIATLFLLVLAGFGILGQKSSHSYSDYRSDFDKALSPNEDLKQVLTDYEFTFVGKEEMYACVGCAHTPETLLNLMNQIGERFAGSTFADKTEATKWITDNIEIATSPEWTSDEIDLYWQLLLDYYFTVDKKLNEVAVGVRGMSLGVGTLRKAVPNAAIAYPEFYEKFLGTKVFAKIDTTYKAVEGKINAERAAASVAYVAALYQLYVAGGLFLTFILVMFFFTMIKIERNMRDTTELLREKLSAK